MLAFITNIATHPHLLGDVSAPVSSCSARVPIIVTHSMKQHDSQRRQISSFRQGGLEALIASCRFLQTREMLRQVLDDAFSLPIQPLARHLYEVVREIRKIRPAEGCIDAAPWQLLQPPQNPESSLGAFHGFFSLLEIFRSVRGLRQARIPPA